MYNNISNDNSMVFDSVHSPVNNDVVTLFVQNITYSSPYFIIIQSYLVIISSLTNYNVTHCDLDNTINCLVTSTSETHASAIVWPYKLGNPFAATLNKLVQFSLKCPDKPPYHHICTCNVGKLLSCASGKKIVIPSAAPSG